MSSRANLLLALGVSCLIAVPAAAQETGAAPTTSQNPVSFGAQLSFADDTDLGIGVRAMVGTENLIEETRFVGSFDWFFPDEGGGVDVSYWELNLNGHYMLPFELDSPIDFYAGGGLNIAHLSVDIPDITVGGFTTQGGSASDTDIGLNILGGLDFRISDSLGGFGELRIELGGGEQFVLTGGVRF